MNNPLVSVNVLSYNAESFVIETLESIKNQTYQNIELIVSDDASTDNTVELCRKWINENKSRFIRIELLTVEKNTGVSGNANRALAASQGVWRKGIGSDDLLFPDCVEKFIDYTNKHPEAKFVFGKDMKFTGSFSDGNFEKCEIQFKSLCLRDSVTAKFQHKFLTRHFFGCPPGAFMNIEAVRSVGGFDEKYPMNEDTSLYLRLTKANIKLHYMDEYVVWRRVNPKSISRTKLSNALLTENEIFNFKRGRIAYEFQSPFWIKMSKFGDYLTFKVIESGNDKRSFKCRYYDFNRRWLNPYKWDMIFLLIKDKFWKILGY